MQGNECFVILSSHTVPEFLTYTTFSLLASGVLGR